MNLNRQRKLQQLAMSINRLEQRHGTDHPSTRRARAAYWRLHDQQWGDLYQQDVDDTHGGFLAGTGRM